ncbi:MAG: hypothetical protein LBS99_04590 [Clostridiales bacterium]|jgi:hypothetical protein|nr:hypothetical protein [Clostridiales bacterium]
MEIILSVFFAMLFLSALTVEIKARAMGYVNLLSARRGYAALRLFNIPIYSATVELDGNKILLINKRFKPIQIKLSADKNDKDSVVNYLNSAFLRVLDVIDFDLYFTGGVEDNVMAGALITAGARAVIIIVGTLLKALYPDVTVTQEAECAFSSDELQLSFNCIIGMSLADIIYGFVMAQAAKVKRARRVFKRKNREKSRLRNV